ncbi:HD domain-containing protein [Roseibium sp.]|uniref:HD domain-containing protein n=1 Tax=Roseibium sp. TaxID=1936156 RepID=UPI0026285715|nr:HD domain-containing protein [Roseibium sp.]
MPEKNAALGTVAWGKRSGQFGKGRLTRGEKLQVLLNLARISILEARDAVFDRLGLINAYGVDLDGLQPPDTPLVRDAFDFADNVQSLELMRHSWRTYYWAMLLGGYRNLDVDREMLFAAAILHDVGLARGRTSEPKDCCFVVYGAERCKHHLVGKGHDRAKVRKIADAIGLHLNAYVSHRLHGAEAHLLSRGAMCDVFGMGRRRIGKSVRNRIFKEHPKGDMTNELEIWPGHHLSGSRGDFLIGLNKNVKSRQQSKALPQAGE